MEDHHRKPFLGQEVDPQCIDIDERFFFNLGEFLHVPWIGEAVDGSHYRVEIILPSECVWDHISSLTNIALWRQICHIIWGSFLDFSTSECITASGTQGVNDDNESFWVFERICWTEIGEHLTWKSNITLEVTTLDPWYGHFPFVTKPELKDKIWSCLLDNALILLKQCSGVLNDDDDQYNRDVLNALVVQLRYFYETKYIRLKFDVWQSEPTFILERSSHPIKSCAAETTCTNDSQTSCNLFLLWTICGLMQNSCRMEENHFFWKPLKCNCMYKRTYVSLMILLLTIYKKLKKKHILLNQKNLIHK